MFQVSNKFYNTKNVKGMSISGKREKYTSVHVSVQRLRHYLHGVTASLSVVSFKCNLKLLNTKDGFYPNKILSYSPLLGIITGMRMKIKVERNDVLVMEIFSIKVINSLTKLINWCKYPRHRLECFVLKLCISFHRYSCRRIVVGAISNYGINASLRVVCHGLQWKSKCHLLTKCSYSRLRYIFCDG